MYCDLWVLWNINRLTPFKQFFPDKKLSTGDISETGTLSVPNGSTGAAGPISSLSTPVISIG
jgi:hypothetical protein